MKRAISAIAFLVAAVAVAAAGDYHLKSISGTGNVVVWKSKEAHDEGLQLINAGVHRTNPSLLENLLACIPKEGAQVVVTDMGFATHDILVVDGPDAGCRGNIAAEELGR